MGAVDMAVRNFKNAINKKALLSGCSRTKVLDWMDEDRRKKEQELKAAWSLGRRFAF